MTLRTFSYGGGVQSTTCLALAAQGKIDYKIFLFANVGEDSENPNTLLYVNKIAKPYAEEHGIELIELRKIVKGKERNLYQYLVSQDNRSIKIPMFMGGGGGPGRRNCTSDYKIEVISRWQKQHGATADAPTVCGLGISMDEVQRMRIDSGIPHQVLEYPLIDMRLTRNDCREIIADAGLPVPPKSACWFCPYQKHDEWQKMKRENPGMFQRAIELESRLNEKRDAIGRDMMYLHPSLVPIDQAVGLQYTLFEDEPCESGYCFV